MMRSVLVAVGVLAMALPAAAQDTPNQWIMKCNMERGRDCAVSAMVDNFGLGAFLIVSYSAAYTTLTIVADGIGQRASMQVDNNPWVSTNICAGGGVCSYDQGKSGELLAQMKAGSQIVVQVSLKDDSMAGPLQMTLKGFDAQLQRAVAAQRQR